MTAKQHNEYENVWQCACMLWQQTLGTVISTITKHFTTFPLFSPSVWWREVTLCSNKFDT